MLKYVDTQVVFQEIPDEITLAINISNCPCHCVGCHSPYLAEDIGETLLTSTLLGLIENNRGVSCIAFMGGDNEPLHLNILAKAVKDLTKLKTAWYSGREELSQEIDLANFDFIKLGPYMEELGGLDKRTTNQVLLQIDNSCGRPIVKDITSKFWK